MKLSINESTGSAAPSTSDTGTTSTQSNQLETSSNEPKSSEVTKPLTQVQKEKLKFKIDGEEVEHEVDWNDRAALTKELQLAKAAKKRMTEAAEIKRRAGDIVKGFESEESFLEMVKRHPKGREIAEKFLLNQIQDEMLSPEEKALRAERAELEALRKEKKDNLTKAEQAQLAQKEAKYIETFQNEIIEATKKTGLPVTPDVIKRMAALKAKALDMGLDLDSSDLAEEFKNEEMNKFKAMIAAADGAQLVAMFGADVAKKIRQHDLKGLMEKQNQVFPKGAGTVKGQASQSEQRVMTTEEWKESLKKRWG